MHSANDIVDQFSYYQENLKKRGFDINELDKVLELNKQRKALTTEVETLRSQVKSSSKEIGALKKSGGDADSKVEEVGHLKSQIEVKNNLLDEIHNNIIECSLIIISHRKNSVKYCDKVLLLEKGKLIKEGSVEEIFEDYD